MNKSFQEMDVKAGGGQVMKLGMVLRQWLVKLEWFSTLFPRIPVPIQQKIQKHLEVLFQVHHFHLSTFFTFSIGTFSSARHHRSERTGPRRKKNDQRTTEQRQRIPQERGSEGTKGLPQGRQRKGGQERST